MLLRRFALPAFAALMLTDFAAVASAQPQTETQHHTRPGHHAQRQHQAQTRHHAQPQHHTGRTHGAAHGGTARGGMHDRGPTTSDRGAADQLNARSLEQARGGDGAVR